MSVIPFPKAKSEWFKINNAADDTAEVFIYDVVGDSWIGNDASTVVKQINAITAKKISLRINSPGGSVFDGVAIYNALARHPAEVTTYIDGLAASIASVIALAGTKVVMAENAMLMIHNPWTMAMGEATELRKTADVLDQIKETLINTYATCTKKERKEIHKAMDEETWFTADEAMAWGLVTSVEKGVKAAACVSAETLSAFGFKKAPESLQSNAATPQAEAPKPLSSTPRSLLERKQALIEKTNK
jgi:ATP-dependent Clp endopeptidase proteolytic subunit ClpP